RLWVRWGGREPQEDAGPVVERLRRGEAGGRIISALASMRGVTAKREVRVVTVSQLLQHSLVDDWREHKYLLLQSCFCPFPEKVCVLSYLADLYVVRGKFLKDLLPGNPLKLLWIAPPHFR